MARAWVGTSGWRYPPWRGVFYPPRLPQRRELAHLAGLMNSVEINGSFYSLQRPESYRAWAAETPDDFVFAVKGSRYITHLKQLRDVRVPLANFLASGLLALGPKLGPLLWQLPPRLRFDAARIDEFLTLLPRSTGAAAQLAGEHDARLDGRAETTTDADRPLRHALEVRHESFRDPAFVELLRAHDVALVVADTAGTFPRIRGRDRRVRLRPPARRHGALHERLLARGARRVGDARAGVARGGVAGRRAHGGAAGRPGPARRVRLLRQRREGARPVRRDRARRAGRLKAAISGYGNSVQSRSSDTVEGPASGPVDEETQALLAERAGELALSQGLTVAVAESLTGGMIATALAAAERSSEWFLGSVVAYASQVKHDVLDVPDGPVVSATAASAMARGVRRLLKADVAVAVTGAGGPGGQDGREPGTVFVAFDGADEHRVLRLGLDDEPKIVCATSAVASLRVLVEGLEVLAGERRITDAG